MQGHRSQTSFWQGRCRARYTRGMDAPEKRRWYRPTPAWLVLGSLVVTGLLFLSEKWRWFWFNEHKGWTVLIAVAAVGVTMLVMLLWWLVALVFRLRFQFGIRTLLVLAVDVALPCSWLAVEMKQAREQKVTVAAIEKLDGGVEYDWEFDKNGVYLPNARIPGSAWIRNLLGDHFITEVVFAELSYTQVTDSGLSRLASLRHLETLMLTHTEVTDAGLANVAALTRLRRLSLASTEISDAGLTHLAGLTQLDELYLYDTQVTAEGVAKLRQSLPNCRIESSWDDSPFF